MNTFLLSVDIHEGKYLVENRKNCHFEKIQEENSILVKKKCNGGNEKTEEFIIPTNVDVQEQLKLSYTDSGRNFERIEIFHSAIKEFGVVSFTKSKIVAKSHSEFSPTANGDITSEGQVTKF